MFHTDHFRLIKDEETTRKTAETYVSRCEKVAENASLAHGLHTTESKWPASATGSQVRLTGSWGVVRLRLSENPTATYCAFSTSPLRLDSKRFCSGGLPFHANLQSNRIYIRLVAVGDGDHGNVCSTTKRKKRLNYQSMNK